MKRIWFKPDCVEWIREGRKTTTFRKNKKEGIYQVVKGSWFKPERVGLVIKLIPIGQTDAKTVIERHFHEEGFNSPWHFERWLRENNLDLPEVGFLHKIEVLGGIRP
ncbi:MAG: hypothetical protein DRP11_02685 [Candidatus Aenigmatarchaeota archaeon]|nr:MAG: hypothetical protein DRP11_02685 [Candidatus Aenigmarchaeota archaeon]